MVTDANQREKKYRHILKELNDLIVECTGAGIIKDVYGNVRLTGYAEPDLIGQPISFLFPSQPITDQFLKAATANEASGRIFRGRIQRRDGSIVHMAVSMSRIPDETPLTIVLTIRDVTRKMELGHQNRQMLLKVREAEKLAYVGSLVQGLTHNLQGSLASILGRAQMLSLRYPGERELEELVLSAKTMGESIRSLLVKMSGEQQTSEQELDLNEVLKSELRVLESDLFFKHKVEKQYYFDKHLPTIRGIYGDFSQSFTNLIRNALEAMREAPRKRLLVATSFDDENILISISDTGTGIEEKNVNKIFEPSFTTKTVKIGDTEDFSGLGLGLASVKELLTPYRVKFEVRNNPEAGVIFRLRIPYEKVEALDEQVLSERAYERVRKVIQQADHLPTIPDILYEVVDASNTEVSVRRLVPMVEQDYALTSKVFSIINSAYYGLRNPVTNLSQAIVYIGLQELRDICYGLLSQQILSSAKRKSHIAELWNHSLATAVTARQIMKHLKKEIEYGYVTGLLHDIGRVILMDNYEKLAVNKRSEEPGRLDRQEEFRRFRTTHDVVGGWFIREKTRLPESIGNAVADHHLPLTADSGELTRLVALADRLARGMEKGADISPEAIRLGTLLDLVPDELRSIARMANHAIRELKKSYRLES